MARDLRILPKANLHLHLSGSMRPATLAELAQRYGLAVPPALDTGIPHEWVAFQTRYDTARDVLRTPADVRRVVLEAAEDCAADGCGWLEIQVDPTGIGVALGGVQPALEAVLGATADALIPTRVVVASSWARSGDHALMLAKLAIRYIDSGVVGFGLSNDERMGSVGDFIPACDLAAKAGLLVNPHSGFYTGADHVLDCVTLLGAGRIGHGTSAAYSAAVMDVLASRIIPLEICPMSYPPLGVHTLSSLPVRELLDAGVPIAIGSDDPLLFGVGLAGQYELLREHLGLSDAELARIAVEGVMASTAPDSVKAELAGGVAGWMGV
ncbi:adenosine deaminase [Pseudonocardiaceae bacterium YIM PH 21723]|nr:adenosine deaminase [Pseudonocardiaceae bacterium YIM PH 21723]